jgi:hypothetical protein
LSFRNDLRLDGNEVGEGAEEAPRSVAEKLPAFYRENPALVAPFADTAEDLISSLRLVFAAEEERISREARLVERSLSPVDAGTPAGFIRFLEERMGVAPLVWSGFEADAHPAGGLVLRRATGPSAILAWEKSQVSSAPAELALLEGLLPLGVRAAAVILGRIPRGGVPQSGERISGELVWKRDGAKGTLTS